MWRRNKGQRWVQKLETTAMITLSRFCWLVIQVLERAVSFSVSSLTLFMILLPQLVFFFPPHLGSYMLWNKTFFIKYWSLMSNLCLYVCMYVCMHVCGICMRTCIWILCLHIIELASWDALAMEVISGFD